MLDEKGASSKAPLPVAFDVERVRADFPALSGSVHGHPLVYLDNAATTQLPEVVIDALARASRAGRGNVHRGVHALSERATHAYEAARSSVQRFLNAREAREIVFVRGATEAINLVAHSYGRSRIRSGDEVIVSAMEHHSNLVPWQMMCEDTDAELRVLPITDAGDIELEQFATLLGPRTRMVALAHVSNAIGTINPVRAVVELAHARGIPVLIDGAQAAPHVPIDVQALGCDFYVFSGHKLYAPSGIGVLYGRAEELERMPPFMGGGEMVRSVSFAHTTFAELPAKFEAGTPNVEGAVGLGAAIEYLSQLDLRGAWAHEATLLAYATERVAAIAGARLIGTARRKAPVLSFVLAGTHAHDIGTILDQQGVAIRAGHHCAQPLIQRFGVPATARASFALYNTRADVDALCLGLERVREILG